MQTIAIRTDSILEILRTSLGDGAVDACRRLPTGVGYVLASTGKANAHAVARRILNELDDPDAPDAAVAVEAYADRETGSTHRIIVTFPFPPAGYATEDAHLDDLEA